MKSRVSRRLLALLMCLTVTLSFSAFAFADDGSDLTAKKAPASVSGEKAPISIGSDSAQQNDTSKAAFIKDRMAKQSFVVDDSNGDYIWWNRATPVTLYKGQKLYIDFTMFDTWADYYTIPFIEIYDSDIEEKIYYYAPADPNEIVNFEGSAEDCYDNYTGYVNLDSANLPAGEYVMFISAMPCDSEGWWADNYTTFDIPTEVIFINVKKLPKPTNVKLTAGKKSVTITYKKATGATKYQIYRSTKKNSGYKKIITTSKLKYIDKTAKKGKRYYYKVRAMRGSSAAGYAYSFYTTPKQSAKVK